MELRKPILYAALIFIVYSLWTAWHKDYPQEKPTLSNYPNQSFAESNQDPVPSLPNEKSETTPQIEPESSEAIAKTIQVKTDVLDLMIDTKAGNIVHASLIQYPVSVDEKDKPFALLNNQKSRRYVANSNLLVHQGQKTKELNFNFQTSATHYQLENEQNTLTVVLEGMTDDGLKVKKIFTLTRGSYLISVHYELNNQGDQPWQGYLNTQVLRKAPEDTSSIFQVSAYTGASFGAPGHNKYQKVSFKDMSKSNLQLDVTGGWIAMQEHYFLTAWIPEAKSKDLFYTRMQNDEYTIGSVSKAIQLAAGSTAKVGSQLYLGPENTEFLATLAPGLEMTVDYGFFWFISGPLFKLMSFIYSFIGNWGWTIVLVTILIKALFYRLSARSYRSMAGMRRLQPKLVALKERYGDDKAKLSQATMELYRQEKVNPLGGCLPILVQIPVFIGLYWVLLESVEFRQAPFIFWIRDLSVMDPYHVLPLIMGATMLIQQRLNPAPPDPVQAKMMMLLPLVFTALFWSFPSGLVLYWIVNNTLSILQQWYITRKYGEPSSKTLAPANSSGK